MNYYSFYKFFYYFFTNKKVSLTLLLLSCIKIYYCGITPPNPFLLFIDIIILPFYPFIPTKKDSFESFIFYHLECVLTLFLVELDSNLCYNLYKLMITILFINSSQCHSLYKLKISIPFDYTSPGC